MNSDALAAPPYDPLMPAVGSSAGMSEQNGLGGVGGRRLAQMMGRVGGWSFALQRMAAAEALPAARQLETLGYPAIWFPESVGSKEAMAHAALLLGATERAV